MTAVVRRSATGLALVVAVAAVVGAVWGRAAVVPAAVFGVLAAAIHVLAVGLLEPVLVPPYDRTLKRWAVGMGLRLTGVALLAGTVFAWPETFPPLPTVTGFLAVLIPLLFGEMRLVMHRLRKRER